MSVKQATSSAESEEDEAARVLACRRAAVGAGRRAAYRAHGAAGRAGRAASMLARGRDGRVQVIERRTIANDRTSTDAVDAQTLLTDAALRGSYVDSSSNAEVTFRKNLNAPPAAACVQRGVVAYL
jgi:hypothetical protein